MNKSKRYIVFGLALVFTLGYFGACKRTLKKDEVLGPGLVSAPSDFSGILGGKLITRVFNSRDKFRPTYHNSVIDKTFEIRFGFKDNIIFEANLSHKTSWFLELEGQKSGAKKRFSGTGDVISLTSDTIMWTGEADDYRFFISGESVIYKISFMGSALQYVDTLTISSDISLGAKNNYGFKGYNTNGDSIRFIRVDDFELGGGIQTSYGDAADQFGKVLFVTKADQYNDTKYFKSVDGYLYYHASGTDLSRNNYLGGCSHETLTELWGQIGLNIKPESLYINAYIYGYGKPNSAVFFQVYENDKFDPKNKLSKPTNWDGRNNDMWQFIQEVNWIGWKLVSIPYSAFKPANNPNTGGNGNRILEPSKISGFGLEIESYPNPGYNVEVATDVITLSENAPFQP